MFKKIFLLAVFACISLSSNQQLTKLGTYYVSDIPMGFVQCHEICKKNGLIFATEQNQKETDAINVFLAATGKKGQIHWLGGAVQTKEELHGEWVWLDINKEILGYIQWQDGEPSDNDLYCLSRLTTRWWSARSCIDHYNCLCQES